MQRRVLFGVTQKSDICVPLPFFLRTASIMARWVGVWVVGGGLLPRVSVGLRGYQTDWRVVGAAGFLVVVLADRFLPGFSVFRHLDRPPRCGRLLCLCVA